MLTSFRFWNPIFSLLVWPVLLHSFLFRFFHSFYSLINQQMFIQPLLCSRWSVFHWGSHCEQTQMFSLGVFILMREAVTKPVVTQINVKSHLWWVEGRRGPHSLQGVEWLEMQSHRVNWHYPGGEGHAGHCRYKWQFAQKPYGSMVGLRDSRKACVSGVYKQSLG